MGAGEAGTAQAARPTASAAIVACHTFFAQDAAPREHWHDLVGHNLVAQRHMRLRVDNGGRRRLREVDMRAVKQKGTADEGRRRMSAALRTYRLPPWRHA